ncbi:S-adenosyl-L-methionine-dependent methyltransferase [Xylariaceae sp. FL0016]|nr:S-adenosyl-L-methionine-dependent methyltransferase [Xylariaceae sp. FL0016]
MGDTKEFAKGYTVASGTQQNAGLFLIDKLKISPGMHILDVGCGPGNLTSLLRDLVGEEGKVVGIDPSEERVALARELTTSNLEFFEARAEDLSRFPAASFDIVFVNSTLHWVQDQPKAMGEFARVLCSGGRVSISGGSGDFVSDQERIKEEVLSRDPYRAYPEQSPPKFLKKREMEQLLDQAGFGSREMVTNEIVKSARDGEEMIDWLDVSSSGKTYGGIPLELRSRARKEMKLEWDKITTEKGIRMVLELLVTVAVKK